MPSTYLIENEQLQLSLAIVQISFLHMHEETIPKLLKQLMQLIKIDQCVKNPVIVDEKSLVVLDGMHRVVALERLGYKRVPACLIDYGNQTVEVHSWYRTVKASASPELIASEVEQADNSIQLTEGVEDSAIGVFPVAATMKTKDKTFLVNASFKNLFEAYNVVKRIEMHLSRAGCRINYETEKDAAHELELNEVDAIVCTPRLTKSVIIETALSGKLFAFKATRHVIPVRPLNLNVPLSFLQDDVYPMDKVNSKLKEMLQKRQLKRLPSGSIFDGRRYEEELYVFEGK